MTTLVEGYIHFLAAMLLAVAPVMQVLGRRRARAILRRLDAETRPDFYFQQSLVLGVLAAMTLPPVLFGLAALKDYRLFAGDGLATAAGLLAALGIWLAYRWIMADPRRCDWARRWARRHAGPDVMAMTPASRRELPGWDVMSAAAGIAEELAYRGFLLWYLSALVPPGWAILLSAAGFAAAHAYQGLRSVLVVFALGLIFGGLVVLSGSLWPAILLHALVDLEAGRFYMRLKADLDDPAHGIPGKTRTED